MYALKRFAAYAIDMMILVMPMYAGVGLAEERLGELLPESMHAVAMTGMWAISLAVPVCLVGALVGLTGRTPGKLILFLKVEDRHGQRPGLAQGILREAVKAVSMTIICGAFFALYGLVTRGRTFYDDWLGLDVEDLKPSGLTETQKNWRKQMRDARRQAEP